MSTHPSASRTLGDAGVRDGGGHLGERYGEPEASPCSSGGAAAGAEAVLRFEGDLRRFVARRVSGPDADDVLQDVLLRIHLGIGALRAQERLAP